MEWGLSPCLTTDNMSINHKSQEEAEAGARSLWAEKSAGLSPRGQKGEWEVG